MKIDTGEQQHLRDGKPELPHPHLVDQDVEDANYREKHLKSHPEDGLLCISIEAGDELGEIRTNIQFEALKGRSDLCAIGQNRVLLLTADLLNKFLRQISAEDAEWEVTLTSKPCDKTDVKVATGRAQLVLRGELSLEQALTEQLREDPHVVHPVQPVVRHGPQIQL